MSFDPPSVDLTTFLKKKSQEITNINTKSSQNAYEMSKFCNLKKKTGKKTTELSQKS